jgi:hypothetical protein
MMANCIGSKFLKLSHILSVNCNQNNSIILFVAQLNYKQEIKVKIEEFTFI